MILLSNNGNVINSEMLSFLSAECCEILGLASTDLTKKFYSKSLGVYEHVGYSRSKMYYKNKIYDRVIHYGTTNGWLVSPKSDLGTGQAYVDSGCNTACPSTCENWKTWNSTGRIWEKDTTFTIKCAGWYPLV